jgi:hypothetical protein
MVYYYAYHVLHSQLNQITIKDILKTQLILNYTITHYNKRYTYYVQYDNKYYVYMLYAVLLSVRSTANSTVCIIKNFNIL